MMGMRRTNRVFRMTPTAPCSAYAAPQFSGTARVLIQTLLGNRPSSYLVAYVSWDPKRDRTCTQVRYATSSPLFGLSPMSSHISSAPRCTFFAQPPPPAVTQALRGRRPENAQAI